MSCRASVVPIFPPHEYVARRFPDERFPAELVLKAKLHRDYAKLDPERKLRFIARYIAGGVDASPEYALKITENSPDLYRN